MRWTEGRGIWYWQASHVKITIIPSWYHCIDAIGQRQNPSLWPASFHIGNALDSSLPEACSPPTGRTYPGTVQFSELSSDSQADANDWNSGTAFRPRPPLLPDYSLLARCAVLGLSRSPAVWNC